MARIEPIPWEDLAPEARSAIEAGLASGAYTTPVPLQIFAYAPSRFGGSSRRASQRPADPDRHPQFPDSLLDGRMLELLRIRSGQLGGCDACMSSKKMESITDDDVACLMNPALRQDLTERERRALTFLDLLATDHHKIDDETYRGLAEVFTTAEIIEMGMFCANMIGTHRFLHTLDVFGETDPVIRYAPEAVGARWADLHETTPAKKRSA